MTDYVDLDTIHTPATDALVPVSWGHGIGQNFDHLHRPYAMSLQTFKAIGDYPLSDASLQDIAFETVIYNSGDFYSDESQDAQSFVCPRSGFYAAAFAMTINLNSLKSDGRYEVSVRKNDDTYLMRSSAHHTAEYCIVNGLVYMSAGDNFAFTGYQESDSAADITFAQAAMCLVAGV